MPRRKDQKRKYLPLALAGAGGAGIGILTAGIASRTATATAVQMAESVLRFATLSTTGPIIASGLLTMGIIVAAIAIPAVVTFAVLKSENTDGKKEDQDADAD